jgi:GntR family transcriptional regulator
MHFIISVLIQLVHFKKGEFALIIIDYNDKRPIYEQIIDKFETLILNGGLEPNMQLPSVRALAIELSINANTIQRAYSELEREGFIYSVKGRGNFVRDNKSLAEKQKSKLLHDLKEQLVLCKSFGIEYDDIHASLLEVYMEVKQ